MTPVLHCSAGNIQFFPGTSVIKQHKCIQSATHNNSITVSRLTSSRLLLSHQSSSLHLFHIYRSSFLSKSASRIQGIPAVVETDVTTVDESSPTAASSSVDNDSKTTEANSETAPVSPVSTTSTSTSTSAGTTATTRSRRSRPPKKSEMPPVKDELLIPGASFTGKVRSIQPFGAFIDFGAFSDGLVHVSRLSDGYVEDVNSVVSIGQEVKVKILEVNMETKRISLTMRENDDAPKKQPKRESGGESSDRPSRQSPRKNMARSSNQKRDEEQKTSKFVKGQLLTGTVKNTIRSGSFVSLPEGEEGYIPVSEESEGYGNVSGNSSLTVGQEVNVRVLRIARGKVTLTMKKEEDVAELNRQLNKGVWHEPINPFKLAFRSNKDIATFLDEQEKNQIQKSTESEKIPTDTTLAVENTVVGDPTSTEEKVEEKPYSEAIIQEEEASSAESVEVVSEIVDSTESLSSDSVTVEEKEEKTEEATKPEAVVAVDVEKEAMEEATEEVTSLETPVVDELKSEVKLEDVEKETTSDTPVVDKVEEVVAENDLVSQDFSSNEEIAEPKISNPVPEASSEEISNPVPEASSEEISNSVPEALSDETAEPETSNPVAEASSDETAEPEISSPVPEASAEEISNYVLEDSSDETAEPEIRNPVPEASSEEIAEPESTDISSVQTDNTNQSSPVGATISPALVKQLRQETGAGMMDCKKALSETGGDIVKAQEFLRKKGLASADKKAGRATSQGRIGSYIHDSRIGVLIEVNCETDFVSRGEIFKQLVDDLAMQVAACPQVSYLVTEDVPEEFVKKEREIEMQKEDLLSKPEQIRSKIVDGRIKKRLDEFALLEQPFIKNDKLTVKDYLKQTIATIGENMKVSRFARYNLGEGLEKKSQDFAAEVAAQTAAKEAPAAAPSPPKEEPIVEKAVPAVAVPAALVKQLREETGAGMMDCKKALAETGGDLEKAQEFLRKKGLSSADKKSSRLAAEGRIGSYIHDSRIGCLIEVNSETDFVARNEKFKELVDDLAMQVVACPQVQYVSVEDIPKDFVDKEKEIEMGKDDLQSKPENIREKIVEGRISKRLNELALLEQPFIKDDKILVKDLVKQTVASLGENIRVRRFVRFTLGEHNDD